MTAFFPRLNALARERHTLLCVGLDPHPEDLPAPTAAHARDFCLRLIDATAPHALAFKPNAAFFEIYGAAGWEALQAVIEAARATGLPVVLDAKRGDIASTARAYARAAFHTLQADALTVNPYLGRDAVLPFLEADDRGVFLLAKTSNPGSADVQDARLASGELLYAHVVRQAQAWGTAAHVGLVVGATHPEALAQVRALAPQMWFLAPGVGAQGGSLEDALHAGLRADGLGMLIAVSRGISRADDPAQAARALTARIRAFWEAQAERGAAPGGAAPPAGQQTKAATQHAPEVLHARALRKNMTEAERALWQRLRAKQLGVRFRRQHPIGPYVLDFYCYQARLAVEVDGGQHDRPLQRAHDAARTRFLERQGIRVLRFWNHEVLHNMEGVLEAIVAALQERLEGAPLTPPPFHPPSPLPRERGGGKEGGEERGEEEEEKRGASIAAAARPPVAAHESANVHGQSEKASSASAAFPNRHADLRETIARALVTTGCVRFGEFTLKSGLRSPIYIDLRLLASFPDVLADVAKAYAHLLNDLDYDRLAALPYAALPIGTAVALHTGDPLIYPRKETKAYGTRAAIEGIYRAGEHAVMLDDLATTGGSKLEAAAKLRAAELTVSDVVVLIDRQSGAREELAAHGLRLHAVFTLRELLAFWEAEGLVSPERAAQVRAFLQESG